MNFPMLEAGRSYRLLREFEIRNEETGVMKNVLRAGTVLNVKRVVPDENQAWVEGVTLPLPLDALRRAVV